MRVPADYANRADNAEVLFVERALTYVETEAYNTEFPPLEGLKYVPTVVEGHPGAKFTAYKQYTRTGIARLVTARGQDLPTTKLYVNEYSHPYARLGISYEYTMDDLLAAQFAAQGGGPSLNIDLEQALAAREGIDRALDCVAGIGSATSATIPGLSDTIGADIGLLGLLNQPNASTYTPAAGAASASTAWSGKTPDEKVADLTGMYASVVNSTRKIFKIDTILLPILQFENANGQRMGDGSDETVISFFKKIKKDVTIDSWQYCAGAGTNGVDRAVGFMNNKRYVRHTISQTFQQLPVQMNDFEFKVPCTAKTAGVICPYPLSIVYMDSI